MTTSLSNQMQDVMVAFAKTGNPATAEAKIPRYNPKREQRLMFGDAEPDHRDAESRPGGFYRKPSAKARHYQGASP